MDTISNNAMHYYRIKAIVNGKEIISNTDSAYISLTNVKQNLPNKTAIYPNPVFNYLNINSPFVTSLLISDLSGKILLEKKGIPSISEIKLDLQFLVSGMYIISVTNENGLIYQ